MRQYDFDRFATNDPTMNVHSYVDHKYTRRMLTDMRIWLDRDNVIDEGSRLKL